MVPQAYYLVGIPSGLRDLSVNFNDAPFRNWEILLFWDEDKAEDFVNDYIDRYPDHPVDYQPRLMKSIAHCLNFKMMLNTFVEEVKRMKGGQ